MKKITIAIDGVSSTGKSTLAKELAKEMKYTYIDTGAMYRAITLYAINKNYINEQFFKKNLLIEDLNNIDIKFVFNEHLGYGEIYLNGKNVEHEIRNMKVSNKVSIIATVPEVRKRMILQQREMGKNKGVILDGRDIGTVVFPDAEVKIFMTASTEIRAKRRFDELNSSKSSSVSYDEVLKNVTERDHLDSTRQESPLKKAKDSITYDNSNKTKEEQFKEIKAIIYRQIEA